MDVRWMESAFGTLPRRDRGLAPPVRRPSVVCAAPISGLIFEMSGVLYDDSAWQRWLLQLLSRIGLNTQYEPFFRVFESEHLHDVHCGRRDYWDALREFLASAGLSRGQLAEVEAAGHARHRQCDEEIRPLPGVASTLAQLAARHVQLAILTNSPCSADVVHARLKKLGLGERFQHVISSRDIAAAKPAPESYRAALDAVKLPAREVALVARDAGELHGARAAGLLAVAIHYSSETRADVYLDRFEQLQQALTYKSSLQTLAN